MGVFFFFSSRARVVWASVGFDFVFLLSLSLSLSLFVWCVIVFFFLLRPLFCLFVCLFCFLRVRTVHCVCVYLLVTQEYQIKLCSIHLGAHY